MAVFIVKDSLALAFSLAGIAAVVRWRAALREAMDGVFMFVMIGIGLAAGVQLLVVALVASIVFNFAILVLNRNRFASRPRRVDGWTLAAPTDVRLAPRRRSHCESMRRTPPGSTSGSQRCCRFARRMGEGGHFAAAGRPGAVRIPNHVEKEVVTGSTGEHDYATGDS